MIIDTSSFSADYHKSIIEDTYIAAVYIVFYLSLVELCPAAALMVSLQFSIGEKVKAMQLTKDGKARLRSMSEDVDYNFLDTILWTNYAQEGS